MMNPVLAAVGVAGCACALSLTGTMSSAAATAFLPPLSSVVLDHRRRCAYRRAGTSSHGQLSSSAARDRPRRRPVSVASSAVNIEVAGEEAPVAVPTPEDFRRRALLEHDEEIARGRALFGQKSGEDSAGAPPYREWTDDDFLAPPRAVAPGLAGPDEALLGPNAARIYQTTEAVLTDEEGMAMMKEAFDVIASGRRDESSSSSSAPTIRTEKLTNSDLNEARLSSLPLTVEFLAEDFLPRRIFPMLESRFGIPAEELVVYDGLVLANEAPGRSQPVHRDASLLTVNVPLSAPAEFVGGGVYVEGLVDGNDDNQGGTTSSPLIVAEKGQALCHASGIHHAGHGITAGMRWVLVIFLLAESTPQVARRCHAAGLRALDDAAAGPGAPPSPSALDAAEAAYAAGLEAAPEDHKLRQGAASIKIRRGDRAGYAAGVDRAAALYPPDQRELIHLARTYLERGRPRAALRRLDAALERIGEADLREGAWVGLRSAGWDARAAAAEAAVMCAHREALKAKQQGDVGERTFARTHLPEAIRRARISLGAAPDAASSYLRDVVGHAEHLLREAGGE